MVRSLWEFAVVRQGKKPAYVFAGVCFQPVWDCDGRKSEGLS
jgi:hypothetical protein